MKGPGLRSVRRHRVLIALPLVATAGAIVSTVTAAASDTSSGLEWFVIGGVLAFTTVGALIEDRRPSQVVGRICLTIGLVLVAASFLVSGAIALDSLPGRIPPLGAALAVIGSTMFGLVLFLGGPLLVSRFPDGREPGRLAVLVDGLLAVSGAGLLTAVLRPGPLEFGGIESVDNPLAVAGIPFVGSTAAFTVAFLANGLALILASIGLVRRYVRGSSVVRAQIRWLGAAIGTSIVFLVLLVLTSGDEALNSVVWGSWVLSLLLPPLAIGMAILRYRLYDIDRVISRTISYGLITALMVAVFLLVNLGLQGLLSSVTSGNSLAVAGSTLLAAGLFTPVRRRVQRSVDRRFDRALYDGERTAGAFATRMRDEVDLPTLAGELDATVRRAMAPSSVGLWLRAGS